MVQNTSVVTLKSHPRWWTVKISGPANDAAIDQLIRSYQEIQKAGIRRACLDLTDTDPEFTLVHRRTAEVLEVAMKFQRVGVLVGDAKTAFAIKAATRVPEEGFHVFYDSKQRDSWLGE